MADFRKATYEKFTIECDFSTVMSDSDSIDSGASSVAVLDPDLVDQSATMIDGSLSVSGQKILVNIQAGSDQTLYDVRFRCVTTGGEQYEKTVVLDVRD